MEDLIDLFVYKAASRSDWIESGKKDEFIEDDKSIRNIEILIKIGSINIIASQEDTLKINVYKKLKSKEASREEIDRKLEEEILVNIFKEKDTLYIKSDYEDENFINKNIETSIEIILPLHIKNIRASLEVGNILVKDVETDVFLETRIGNILLENYRGRMDLKCGVGNIAGKNLDLKYKNKVELATGNIDVGLSNREGEHLYLATNIGNIKLDVREDLNCNIEKKYLLSEKIIGGNGKDNMDIILDSKMGSIEIRKT